MGKVYGNWVTGLHSGRAWPPSPRPCSSLMTPALLRARRLAALTAAPAAVALMTMPDSSNP